MEKRISITVDLSKIDKSRIVERTYETKDGASHTAKDYKMDVVLLKPENFLQIAKGETWKMIKKYFVCNSATKEEREQQINTDIVGDGIVFENIERGAEEADPNNIPF